MSQPAESPVLIIDDSLTVRMQLSEAFRSAGFEPTACRNLREARDALTRHPYHVIVLDILLPDGDGISFLKELKEAPSTAAIPVMLLSTEAEVRDRITGIRAGADEYIGKPYDIHFVLSRARELSAARVSTEAGRASLPRITRSVLLVEDSLSFRNELKSALEMNGFHVFAVLSAEEGHHIARALRPDLVIVNHELPGTPGDQFIKQLLAEGTSQTQHFLLLTDCDGPQGSLERPPHEKRDLVLALRKSDGIALILEKIRGLMEPDPIPGKAKPVVSLPPKRVLAVDDSSTYLNELSRELRKEGHEVVLARSGEEALDLLPLQQPDSILMDLNMLGISGAETCRRIKRSAAWRDIPVIMVTAQEDQGTMIACLEAGADDFVAKSPEFDILKARLRAQLRKRQFEQENRAMHERLHQMEAETAQARASRELAETRARLLTKEKAARERAEALERRTQLLYTITGELMNAPLDASERVRCLADLAVPRLADWCIIDLAPSSGRIRDLIIAHPDPAKIRKFRELRQKYPQDRGSMEFNAGLVPQITEEISRRNARAPEHLRLLGELGFKSSMVLSLETQADRSLGTLAFLISDSGRIFDAEDLKFAQELAHRAAIAVENALLYREAQEGIRARDEFLSIASHELKTPLTSALLKLQMVEREEDPARRSRHNINPIKIHEMIRDSRRQISYLGSLIDDLLDLTRIRLGRLRLYPESMELGKLAHEVAERFDQDLSRANTPLHMEVIGNPTGQWDRNRIDQIITNLLSNAVKYGQGKQIDLKIEGDKAAGLARIIVRDRGIGIEPNEQERIFERFERAISSRKVSGLGLGLYIVRQVVEAHGGRIRVLSRPGSGSVFTVELPLTIPEVMRETG